MPFISTGSTSLDLLLGGGIRDGVVTDIFGESGSGKTQLCFTLAVNCLSGGGRIVYVDTVGNFRPERILEIGADKQVLERVDYLRALTTADQFGTLKVIPDLTPDLVIVDSGTSLFSAEFSGPSRHIAVMKYLHDLAVLAITCRCAVVFTNMIRDAPTTVVDHSGRNIAQVIVPSHQREYLGSSVSIYSHFKIKLEKIDATKSQSRARLIQPPSEKTAEFSITARGITDLA